MKAIILAAGKATRMQPLTKETPQSLLKIKEKTIIEKQIETLKEAGIEEIIVMTGYLTEQLEKECERLGIRTLYNPFYTVSGMAMTLWIAKEELKQGFLFLYGDVLFEATTIKELLESDEEVCLATKKTEPREEAEKVVVKEGIIKKISKEEGEAEFIGIAKFTATGTQEIIKEIEKEAKKTLNIRFIEMINKMIEKGITIKACDIKEAKFMDIDWPEDLEKAQNF